ncbi:hypothetical protein Gotri_009510 [Gossypium trilobum]|uniref:Uncharacterized protein n=1 Tax=Gossypium trilobum TaxID=34281 RepID=A0A7J9EMM0_9ROSI|nr:hypothetical protein [Gossypium trilobum]
MSLEGLESWLKINTDGSCCGSCQHSSVGGVCRGSTGDWYFDFAMTVGTSSIFQTRRELCMKVSNSLGSAAIVMLSWRAVTGSLLSPLLVVVLQIVTLWSLGSYLNYFVKTSLLGCAVLQII